MIYLIRSSAFRVLSSGDYEYFTLLKIGYTSESGRSARMSFYKLHNPSFQLLYEIPAGTEEIERAIHYKFRAHRYPDYGREWFLDVSEVTDYFKGLSEGLEDLGDLRMTTRQLERFRCEIYRLVVSIFNSKRSLLGEGTYLGDFIGVKYSECLELFGESSNISEVWNYFEVTEGLLVCETARTLKFDGSNLRDMVISSFSVGTSYPYSVIQEKLRYIYVSCGLEEVISYRLLKDYFEVSEVNIKSKTELGNRSYVKGYKLLKLL